LDKPVEDRVLQAMAQAYPDPVDLSLLSMVTGCDAARLQAAAAQLLHAGLARARSVVLAGEEHLEAPCITDKGMAVADGLAADAEEAGALLDRLEAATLRELLGQRISASRLSPEQAEALRDALAEVTDRALVDAARVWAHQTVSDWAGFVRVMHNGAGGSAATPASAGTPPRQ
jgi:hypothetical protein